MQIHKLFYIIIGALALGLGSVGLVVPLLPTVPFYMLAAICFVRGSTRLHTWFVGTALYQKNLRPVMRREGLPLGKKLRLLLGVTLIMGLGFYMMHAVPAGRVILAALWLAHLIYFLFGIKTVKSVASTASERAAQPTQKKACK